MVIIGNFFQSRPITIVMGNRLPYWVVLLVLLGMGGPATARAEDLIPCEVTTDQDSPPFTLQLIPGSFRQMIFNAMTGKCIDKKIIIKVPKIVMTQALGAAIFSELKGLTIEREADKPQAEIVAQYEPNEKGAVGCSAPSPFQDCFAYLPTSGVTIRNIKFTVSPSAKSVPFRGLCIDKDEDAVGVVSDNKIRLEKNEFNGFSNGGVFVSHTAYGVLITQSIFNDSGPGIVVAPDPASGPIETPSAPIMGGSHQALFAVLDAKGAVAEYHLRGLAPPEASDSGVTPVVELFESDGKAGTHYMQDCTFTKELIDGKWNIDCILPKSISLPFHYAVTLTLKDATAKTSMFSVGTIPVDVAKVPPVTPSTPQPPVTPPKPPISPTNPPTYQEPPNTSENALGPLSLTATPATGGCSLIR